MDKNNIYLFVLLILSLVVTVTVTSALMFVKKVNNQEYKERTLIIIEEEEEEDFTYKYQYTIVQLRKTKIEFESCLFENEVKTYCAYNYPDYNDDDEVAKASIDLLDELKIQPGDTTTINIEDLGEEILDKYLDVYLMLTSPFEY